jgi:3-hydroxyisobutyrate dehydrogenase-like beta-hydroxyacid dehydrogenase
MRITFIGFGEVASIFSQSMREHGAQVAAYDLLLDRPQGQEILQRRVRAEGIEFGLLPNVVAGAEYVLSTVTTQAATTVAAACATLLRSGQVFLDLNSTCPSVKQQVAKTIAPSGADFVEGAILDAVGAAGAAAHILTGGPKAREAAATLCRLGLNARFYSLDIGPASMFKMLRSIFSKGLEALLLELLIAGKRAGILEDLWQDVSGFMARNPFDRVAANWIQTHAVAHQRRYQEMQQVLETVRELGLDPLMTAATEAFFERSTSVGLAQAFPEKPASIHAVIEFLEQRLRAL